MSSPTVIVIGGGLAGLSSAIALADRGLQVRLFEKRPHLGGRATSYTLPGGEHVDNCQHVTLGCCTNLDDFYARTGASAKIRWYDRLFFADATGRRGEISPSLLPAPFHLSPSFLKFPLLPAADKRAIARTMFTIARAAGRPADAAPGTLSMLQWLRLHNQPESAIRRFWHVVLVSALDEELENADACFGIDVFWKAFLAHPAGGRLGIPSVPLADLYDGCRASIESRGGEIRTRCGVASISLDANRISALRLDDGSDVSADFYLAALPHDALLEILPPAILDRDSTFSALRNLRVSPITSAHLWYDRTVMAEPYLALLDHTVQWIFNKSSLLAPAANSPAPADAAQYLQLVISASYDLVPKSRADIIALCTAELAQILPAVRTATLVKSTVIKETAATFSPTPESDRIRFGPVCSLENLLLAGDWTATGWPATMEGAVRSGYRAAEAVLASTGSSVSLVRPDLPPRGLTRLFSRS